MAGNPVNASAATSVLDTKELAVVTTTNGEDPLIGRDVIGQYRIEKKLGSGGMGAVYLAQQTSVQRPAVIKVLRLQSGASDKLDLAARFAIEARAASNLNHPNIVTIYNYGQMDDGTLFIAMEYLAGETLEARIARIGQLPVDRAVHIAKQIAGALADAHAHGVVHRDLKPANVMLVERAGESDFVKVLDFGIAKLDDAGVTSTGYVVGTPRYMSPEQLLGKKLDCRSDIYSAGIVLYEMLAGVTPFSSETPMGWLHNHVEVEPKPPSALSKRGKIPPPLDQVVLRILAKAPADRPQSMEMLALDLVAALNAPIKPPPPPWWKRAAGRFAQLAVMTGVALVSASRKSARRIGTSTWRLLRAIGSGSRRLVRPARSGMQRLLARRVAVAIPTQKPAQKPGPKPAQKPAPRPVSTPARPSGRKSLAALPIGRRVVIALVVIVASAALLAALSPKARYDFGLSGDSEAKPGVDKMRQDPVQAPLPAREKKRSDVR